MASQTSEVSETDQGKDGGPVSKKHKMSLSRRRRKSKVATGAEVLANMDRVIFPDNKWIKIWDMVVLFGLFLLMFILPYQIGVSGGFALLTNIPWLVCNVALNSIFFVDTFLYFFRAYRTKDGRLVLSLKTIRRRYLRTYFIPNLLSVLPYTLAFYIVGSEIIEDPENAPASSKNFISFLKFAELTKLVRLVRVRPILSSSDAVTNFRLRHNSQVIALCKYVWLIVVVSHWFACTWSFLADVQVQGFNTDAILETPNWISYWYDGNYVDGGLNPVGWDQHTDRYVLSLFWAIQTITSIGYGNIVPVTVAEWYIACLLQLCAGVIWAYVIGGLVGVTAGMQVREENFRNRTDHANDLISSFANPDTVGEHESLHKQEVANQIRRYIHRQHVTSRATTWSSDIAHQFPVFESLTPDLQHKSSVLLLNQYLEVVPYLSSRYLSFDEQSVVAMECQMLEFAAGETVEIDNCVDGLGRGILIVKQGTVFELNFERELMKDKLPLIVAGTAYGSAKVLLEDGHPASRGLIHFLTHGKVIFVPRAAVLAALAKNDTAWKSCARWMYARLLLREKKFS